MRSASVLVKEQKCFLVMPGPSKQFIVFYLARNKNRKKNINNVAPNSE